MHESGILLLQFPAVRCMPEPEPTQTLNNLRAEITNNAEFK